MLLLHELPKLRAGTLSYLIGVSSQEHPSPAIFLCLFCPRCLCDPFDLQLTGATLGIEYIRHPPMSQGVSRQEGVHLK